MSSVAGCHSSVELHEHEDEIDNDIAKNEAYESLADVLLLCVVFDILRPPELDQAGSHYRQFIEDVLVQDKGLGPEM